MTRLEDIKARWDVATPGPWMVDADEPSIIIHPDKPGGWDGVAIAYTVTHDAGVFPQEHNAEAIAHAPDDVAALVRAVESILAFADSREARGGKSLAANIRAFVASALDPTP